MFEVFNHTTENRIPPARDFAGFLWHKKKEIYIELFRHGTANKITSIDIIGRNSRETHVFNSGAMPLFLKLGMLLGQHETTIHIIDNGERPFRDPSKGWPFGEKEDEE